MAFRDTLAGLLAEAGVTPAVGLSAEDGNVPCTQMVRFTKDDNMYVGLLRAFRMRLDEPVLMKDQRPRLATIDFGRSGHVYDVRSSKYFGEVDKIQAVVAPARARLFAVLPYRIERVDVAELGSSDPREIAMKLGVVSSGGQAGTHVFHVTFTDPQGRVRNEYSKNVKVDPADPSTAIVQMRLALSDPTGKWKITARDTVSGSIGKASFDANF